MHLKELITEIKHSLTQTFGNIDTWFDKPEELRGYKPQNGGWTINQVLEHIGLTNHFLLILIEKGKRKALQHADIIDIQEELKNYTFHREKLIEIGLHKSFKWMRPEHMEPKGEKTLPETRKQLKEQLKQCLDCLEALKDGQGILYKTTMSVNELGKIDVYEYLYFLAQHGQRHITQMTKTETEFSAK